MSDSSTFFYRTDKDDPQENRAMAMADHVEELLAGTHRYGAVADDVGRLVLTDILIAAIDHQRPRQEVRLNLGGYGIWTAQLNGAIVDIETAWKRYLDLLHEMRLGDAPTRLDLKASKAIFKGNDRTVLQVVAKQRKENRVPSKRKAEWATSYKLWRTFGPAGERGVGIMQDHHSQCYGLGNYVSDQGTGSRLNLWRVSAPRNSRLGKIHNVDPGWVDALQAQFAPRIPIRALRPDEWRWVAELPFIESDVLQ